MKSKGMMRRGVSRERSVKTSTRVGPTAYTREDSGMDRTGSQSHMSWGSKASVGASHGPGPVAGAGELNEPGAGPGKAARRIAGMQVPSGDGGPWAKNPSGATPKGMRTSQDPE